MAPKLRLILPGETLALPTKARLKRNTMLKVVIPASSAAVQKAQTIQHRVVREYMLFGQILINREIIDVKEP